MVSRFFEVTRYNAIVTRYGRVTLPKKIHDDLKIILKKVNPRPLSGTEVPTT